MKTILHNMMCRSCREWGRSVCAERTVHGSWFTVLGSWFMVLGSWFKVYQSSIFNHQSRFINHQLSIIILNCSLFVSSCAPEPPLHLYNDESMTISIPAPKLNLEVLWNYSIVYKTKYDWKAEWYYGWDDYDRSLWGEINYTEPTKFYLRRYYTGNLPYGPHLRYDAPAPFYGNHYQDFFDWGFWDILVYNEPQVNVISVHFDESDHDNIIAYTNPSSYSSRYHAPRYTRAFYAPEPLYSGYKRGEEINQDLKGFDYDKENNVWIRKMELELLPVTYVYLTQIILRNNKGRVSGISENCNLTGMALNTNLHTRRSGNDAVSVNYECGVKKDIPLVPYSQVLDPSTATVDPETAEHVDIIGGRLMTFGICGFAPWDDIDEDNMTPEEIAAEVNRIDKNEHYLEVTFTFENSTKTVYKAFPVTDQVRKYFKGGVITIIVNVDDLDVPDPDDGSGFNAIVKDFEEEELPEFDFDLDK